jgi:RNA polymerase sigma-70 factor, ECF subfamily
MRVVARHEDALDVTQDVCLKWLTRGDSERLMNARAWLRTVTVNRALDVVRARKLRAGESQEMLELTEKGPGPGDRVELGEMQVFVRNALLNLTENQRAVLVAKVFDGETFAEIAQGMGLAVPTVKTHYVRALAALEPELRKYD